MMQYLALAVESEIMAWDAPVEADAPTNLNHERTMIEDSIPLAVRFAPRKKIKGTRKAIPEYILWITMRARCKYPSVPSYPNYGGRGIKVCDRWDKSFGYFLEDMGKRPSSQHSLDRINNDGDYEPGNVRWATRREQRLNNRLPSIVISVNGESKPLPEWCEIFGVPLNTAYGRYKRLSTGHDPSLIFSKCHSRPIKNWRSEIIYGMHEPDKSRPRCRNCGVEL